MTESIVRHSCHDSGVCFNDEHRLKFCVFDDCWQTEDWQGEVRHPAPAVVQRTTTVPAWLL